MSPDLGARLGERAWRAAARATPERAPLLLCALARVAFPGARVDVLVRARRGWMVAATRPHGLLPLAVGGTGVSVGASERGDGPRGLSPRVPTSRIIAAGQGGVAADAVLAAEGYAHRVLIPLRIPRLRAILSIATREAVGDVDMQAMAGLARAFEPVLATRARLERARTALRRARFIQRLVAGVNRSLLLEDILRSAVGRVRERVPVARALLVVATGGREVTILRVDDSDDFRHFEVDRLAARARARHVVDSIREPTAVADLADGAEPASGGEIQSDLRIAGFRSALFLPLVSRRKVIGAFVLAAREPGVLTSDHLTLLRDLARPLASAVEKARLFREASELSRQMTALYEVGQALNSPVDTAGVTERVLSILHETFRFQHSAVLTLERDGGAEWLVMQASRGYSLRADGEFRIEVSDRGVTSRAVRTGRLVYVPDVRRDPDYVQGVASGRSEVAVPLQVGGRVVGVLDVESTRVDAFAPEDLETLKLFSTQVALALARARDFEEIRRQAMTDSLTGLLNQRYFKAKVERELDRSRQTGRPFVLALFDIDDFKRINDEFGHVTGDQVIERVGDILRSRLRSIDAAARFGGDEFALILSETDGAAGMRVVEQVRDDLRTRPVPDIGALTVSIGVAQWQPRHVAFRDIVAAADEALYRAKGLGKDRAISAAPADAPAPP